MTFGLLRQVYEKIANIGKQTLHKESEEFNMKKKVLSVILAAVCTMGLMAGCGAEVLGLEETRQEYHKIADRQWQVVKEEYFTATGRCAVKTPD